MPEKSCETVERYRKWKRKHPDFPLTVHANGQWSKKVRGKVYYFGQLAEPDAALGLWVLEKDYLLAGLIPPTHGGGFTVGDLCDRHMADLKERIAAGTLSAGSGYNYRPAKKLFTKAGLARTPVRLLAPDHFTAVQRQLETSGYSLSTRKRMVGIVKAIFNWGKKVGLCDTTINYGPRFVTPSITAIEAEQEETGVVRFFDRELILDALKIADAKMKVVILLGINCAFYPSDTASIAYNHVHLDAPIPYHDFRRVKTQHKRMAALWPETVAAIRDYTDHHRPQSDCDNILLTQYRKPYPKENGSKGLARIFNNLLDQAGNRLRGVGLGSLRHTYASRAAAPSRKASSDPAKANTCHKGQSTRTRAEHLGSSTVPKPTSKTEPAMVGSRTTTPPSNHAR